MTERKLAIAIREKRLRDDSAVLAAMHEADRALRPIWERYPNKTYAEIEAMYDWKRATAIREKQLRDDSAVLAAMQAPPPSPGNGSGNGAAAPQGTA